MLEMEARRDFDAAGRLPSRVLQLHARSAVVVSTGIASAVFLVGTSLGDAGMPVQLLSFAAYAFVLAAIVKFDLSHPYVWFNLTYLLYSIGPMLLFQMGRWPYHPGFSDALVIEFICLGVIALVVSPTRVFYRGSGRDTLRRTALGAAPIFVAGFVLSMIYLAEVNRSDLTSQYDRVQRASPLLALDFGYYLMIVSFSAYCIHHVLRRRRMPVIPTVLAGTFFLLSIFYAGDRYPFYRYAVSVALIYHIYRRSLPGLVVVLAIMVGGYTQSLLNDYKMFFLVDRAAVESTATGSAADAVERVFSSEFSTVGLNLAYLTESVPEQIDYLHGYSILWDVQRALTIGVLANREASRNSAAWFTQTFFPYLWDRGGGAGFGIVGVGYVNFGIWGVVMMGLLLGWVLRWLYRRSVYGFGGLVYVCTIPIMIYAIRSDLSSILSQSLKHVVLPIIVMALAGDVRRYVLQRTHRRRSRGVVAPGRPVLPGSASG